MRQQIFGIARAWHADDSRARAHSYAGCKHLGRAHGLIADQHDDRHAIKRWDSLALGNLLLLARVAATRDADRTAIHKQPQRVEHARHESTLVVAQIDDQAIERAIFE